MKALFTERARAAGCSVEEDAAAELEADYGIAETGSLVLTPSPTRTRASWLEPEVLGAALPEERILPDLESLFAVLVEDMPSAVAIVTGPSRTKDIEQTLVVGLHGPREIRVCLRCREAPRS
ncbi:MAG TPA: LUD domain-containing protein [Gaiellaceae bacterium]